MAEVKYNTPSNSLAIKNNNTVVPAKTEQPKVNSVVAGKVALKEKTKSEKLKENSKNALKTVITNTIAPSVKDLILNAIWNGLSMIFFPDGHQRPFSFTLASRVNYGSSGYSSYSSYYGRGNNQPKVINAVEPAFKNPILYNIDDARLVIDAMRQVINEYGFATWSTLYDLCNIDTHNWQGSTKYGWVSVESTMIDTVYDANGVMAYELRMPKASPIDDMPF